MSDTCDTVDTVSTADTDPRIGNTCNPRARCWVWTWNNYEEIDVENMKIFCEKECNEYHFQPEIGEKCGTPHLQGFWYFKNARTFVSLKKIWDKLHIEKANNIKAAREYCQKSDTKAGATISGGALLVRDPLEGKELRWWQDDIVKLIATEPDDRTVNWYFDLDGGCGKTSLAKHLCLKYPDEVLYLTGGPANCKYGICSFLHNKVKSKLVRNSKNLRVIIFDYTRSQDDKVSYQAIEEVKNGLFYNTKYECMMCSYNSPHVIIFANFMPDESKLSADRWNIIDIGVI